MEEKAKKIAELLKILANEHRLLILCALMQGPLAVGELHPPYYRLRPFPAPGADAHGRYPGISKAGDECHLPNPGPAGDSSAGGY